MLTFRAGPSYRQILPLDISEVGIPYEVARKLTIPEKSSPWNIEFLKKLILNGPFKHPGANYIIRPDGIKIRLDYVTDLQMHADSLAPGFIVERHLADGDIVIFNRQPSLHRMSVMAHYVKVLPYRTFRLHPAVCPPYNSDFDGDEMNLHVPQSEEARVRSSNIDAGARPDTFSKIRRSNHRRYQRFPHRGLPSYERRRVPHERRVHKSRNGWRIPAN